MQNWLATLGATARAFWLEDCGQNLIEHSLLLAFVALASATLFIGAGGKVHTVWSSANSQLAAAATSAS
jgi:Flp pilus assembly pilin Flp